MDQSKENSNRHTYHFDGNTQSHHHPSYTKDISTGGIISSKPAVKRLFSDRVQAQNGASDDDEGQFEDAENGYESELGDEAPNSARKRHRGGEWPLPATEGDARSRAPLGSRNNVPNAPQHPRRSSSLRPRHQRASSFVEGSMNDRASKPPPASYIDHEDRMDEYDAEQQRPARDYARTDSGSYVPRTEPSAIAPDVPSSTSTKAYHQKQSTVVRFGKNVASVFNVSNWKLFSKSTKDSKTGSTVEKVYDIEASQKAYQELMASQKFKAHTTQSSRFPKPRNAARGSPKSPRRSRGHSEEPLQKRDSGVDIPSRQASRSLYDQPRPQTPQKEKRYGRVYDASPVRQHDSRAPSPSMSQSSQMSNEKSPKKRKSSFSLKTSLLTRHSMPSDVSIASTPGPNRMPSKKQIVHEQKLVKKISNLEFQLEEARRQLAASVGEPLPMMTTMASLDETLSQRPAIQFDAEPPRRARRRRQAFVPGALATLPSERLLASHVQQEEEGESESDAVPSNSKKLFQSFSERSEADSFLPSHSQSVARELQDLDTSNHSGDKDVEFSIPPAEREASHSDVSSVHSSEATGETVIHHRLSPDSNDRSQESLSNSNEQVQDNGIGHHTRDDRVHTHNASKTSGQEFADTLEDANQPDLDTPKANPAKHTHNAVRVSGEGLVNTLEKSGNEELDTPKAKQIGRKVSGKRKSIGNKGDDNYTPSRFSDSDDDAAWDEAAKYSTPKKKDSRQNLKKQKISAVDSSRGTLPNKKGSFDSPKEAFVNSTKYAKRASATPPRNSLSGSPRESFQRSPKPTKQTPPEKNAIRKGMNVFPPPPSSPSFNFGGDKYVRPGTPAAIKKQAAPKRPASPNLVAAGSSKRSVQGRPMSSSTQDDDAIPPVPQLSEEILKKHRESGKVKQKKLTMEDVQRHKKSISIAGSTNHPDQDVVMKSIEKDGTAKSTKSHGITKAKEEKGKKDNYQWDEDIF